MKIELETKQEGEDEKVQFSDTAISLSDMLKTTETQHKVLFSPECSSLYSFTRPEAGYNYDYEINLVKFGEENDEEYMYVKSDSKLLGEKYMKIDPSTQLYDSINIPYNGNQSIVNPSGNTKLYKANIFKRLVSKKKRRLQTEYYDLDMCYITERVIGMGFPATGCETLYRNSLTDIRGYLDRFHQDYKIYNLCIEKKRIYPKEIFQGTKVGLFPFNDHAPCPIRLILDFCVDICLYLTSHPKGVAAIHCKAGKGRTGVMIVCYLIFTGLCKNTEEALIHYAKQRTLNNKGVTIASQKRYIKYFETFLCSNYERPYLKCIPKMIKFDLNKSYVNMLMNYNTDMSYFTTINAFKLKSCIIGPFSQDMFIHYSFSAITRKKLDFLHSKIKKEVRQGGLYYVIDINSDEKIDYDLKLMVKGKEITFYSWFNLWYSTFEFISRYVIKNNYFEDDDTEVTRDSNINTALASEDKKDDEEVHKHVKKVSHFTQSSGSSLMTITFNSMNAKHQTKFSKRKSAIQTLKNNRDLNNIIDGIDNLAKQKGVKCLDRTNIEFVVERQNLDKLRTKIKDKFLVKFNYELLN